jgi:hypothetical protein
MIRGRCSPAGGVLRRDAALLFVDGVLPVVIGSEGVADGVCRRMANPEMLSWCPIASSRRGERRLEKARTTVTFGSR